MQVTAAHQTARQRRSWHPYAESGYNPNTSLCEDPGPKPLRLCAAQHMGVCAHSHIHTEGVMNSACCLETCAEISMTKLPDELVTISFAPILSSIINFLSQRRLRLYQPLAAGISAFHLTIIPRIKEQPRCANAQACVRAARCALAPDSQTHRVIKQVHRYAREQAGILTSPPD